MINHYRVRLGCVLAVASAFLFLLSGCDMATISAFLPIHEEAQEEVNAEETTVEPLLVESVSVEQYAYQTLEESTQIVYDEIVYAITNREESVLLATTDPDELALAYAAIRADYCSFFWLESLSYLKHSLDGEIVSIELTPVYSMTAEEQEAVQEQIDAEAERMLASAPVDGTDYDKALYVYETLIREVDYVSDSADNQTIISVFIHHETVCQGYAYATQYLLEKLGVFCMTVNGTVEGEQHAWNLVLLDGAYYYIDTTWGNARFTTASKEEGMAEDARSFDYLNYDYFGVTTEDLLVTHSPDETFVLPVCTATADNYYVHEGLYCDVWDAESVGRLIRTAYEAGEGVVRIRFADAELRAQAEAFFFEEGRLFDYCHGLQSAQYLRCLQSTVLVLFFS